MLRRAAPAVLGTGVTRGGIPEDPPGDPSLLLVGAAWAWAAIFGWFQSFVPLITALQLFLRLWEPPLCLGFDLFLIFFAQKDLEKSHLWVLYPAQP